MFDSAWKLQNKIETKIKKQSNDKLYVIIASMFASMSYLWLYASRLVFTTFDIFIVYTGTIGLLLVPIIIFLLSKKFK